MAQQKQQEEDEIRTGISPCLVICNVIQRLSAVQPELCIEDDSVNTSYRGVTPLAPPLGGDVEDFRAQKLVFKYQGADIEDVREYVAYCRDLMCFYTPSGVIVYSPSTSQSLYFKCLSSLKPSEISVSPLYIASTSSYKLVMMELLPGRRWAAFSNTPTSNSVRFKAIAVPEEDSDGGADGGPPPPSPSWELISEHSLPDVRHMLLGNLIGVNGVVYALITFGPDGGRVISLDFNHHHPQFKIFNPPTAACLTSSLSAVMDYLCFPQATTSTIILWLLKDRNNSCWSRWAEINYASPIRPFNSRPSLHRLLYFPPTTTGNPLDTDDDRLSGLLLFMFNGFFVQYDLHTKESAYLLDGTFQHRLHVFSGRSFSLKNGSSLQTYVVPPPTQPRPRMKPKPKQKLSFVPLLPSSLPTPVPMCSQPPLPRAAPSLPLYCQPPPTYYHQSSSLQTWTRPLPPPQPPLPRASTVPLYCQPAPTYYHHSSSLQTWTGPLPPPLPQGPPVPPPPPLPFSPDNFQYQICSLEEAKRRRLAA